MRGRQQVVKTHKLLINGQFPRSESGRSLAVRGREGSVTSHVCLASRKDLRDAVAAARSAQEGWARRPAYNRGQVLYRMAEMLEGKRAEFESLLRDSAPASVRARTPRAVPPTGHGLSPREEVSASIDRVVAFAGWSDKFSQVLGCHNPVHGPYYNFSVPEAVGVVALVCPDRPALLGLVSLLAPAVCAGNATVVIAGEADPPVACVLGEVCATSDVPAGVVNILTGSRDELVPHVAEHRDIEAVVGAGLSEEVCARLRMGSANNLKRVTIHDLGPRGFLDSDRCESPWWIEPTIETKTIWHPSAS